jgi:hypothetical protein
MQFDDLLFRVQLPRSDHHLIEDLPLHRLVSAQPVGLAAPDASCQVANSIVGERQGHTVHRAGRGTDRLIRRPDDGDAIGLLSLRPLEILLSINAQQRRDRVIGQAVQ